ncbi:Uncharacterised protein [Segatella copri]|nr:Uncharacterised protein [Segatella copri]
MIALHINNSSIRSFHHLNKIATRVNHTSFLLEHIRDAFDETSHLFVFWIYLYLHLFTIFLYFCLGCFGTPGNIISKLFS